VFSEWEVFQTFNRTFYGSPNESLRSLIIRLTDASFPMSKKWVYLCCAPGVLSDRECVGAVLRLGLMLPDTAAQETARVLISRLDESDAKVATGGTLS
jgi:hypothetical protein